MAKFIPELSDIASWRVKPTEGEWYVLTFLKSFLDDTYEVYFNPYLNEDRPDILIMRQYHGVLIIEVKDWNLNNFTVEKASDNNEKKGNDNWKWFYTPNSSPVRSPISQVRKYHDNLMSFHIKDLFKMQLTDFNYTAIISTMVFFYGTTRKWLFYSSRFCEYLKKYDFFNSTEKKNKYVKYNCVFAQDDLNPEKFSTLLNENWIGKNKASIYFTNKIYDCFKQQLTPTAHMMNDGKCLEYTPQQRQIIYDLKNVGHKYIKKESETLNAYIRGAYGSGKTTVLAATAVHTYLKLKNKYSDPHILILCYNITLVNWLRDRLSAASDELSHRVFMISNYHRFINSFFWKKNEFFKIPKSIQTDEDLTKYLEDNYYGNYSLIMQLMRNSSYDHHPPEYYQYDAIFIDEVQDYHREWTKILKNCFLIPGGKFYVFGDEKQNIYGTPVQNKQIDVYFGTRAVSRFYLKDCKRSNTVIQNFLYKYQQHFFHQNMKLIMN